MSARITAAERAALPVARAALESRDSAYGVSDTIVFALGAAGLLADAEVAQAVAGLKADELAPGSYPRMRAALGALRAAQRQHGEGLVPQVWALEAAGLLQSPETAAEFANAVATVARLEQKRVEVERVANAERERAAELEQQLRAARQAKSEQHDDLAGALGYPHEDWADLISIAAANTAALARSGGDR